MRIGSSRMPSRASSIWFETFWRSRSASSLSA
jgi:hypothetical protein